jgi:beta-xylosidase
MILTNCSSRETTENKSTGATNKSENSTAKTTNTANGAVNSPVAGQTQPAEKVEQPTESVFTPGALPEGWRWLDPEKSAPTKYNTKSGVLHIDLPTDKDLYGETRTAPRLLKAISGDFELETKLTFDPKDVYQGAGLLVFRNDSNYIRLERGYGGVGGGESGIRFDKREDEIYEPIATQDKFPTDAKKVELKIRRAGKEFTAFWRLPDGDWMEVGKYSSGYPETVQVGLIACNTAQEIPVEFAYVRLSPVRK